MNENKSSHSVRMVLSLAASLVVGVAGLFLVRWLVSAAWLHANNEVAGNYLQTIGTIYAVLLAFVIFVVWQQHNDTRCAVENEANELSDLYRTLRALPGTQRVQEYIQEYSHVVAGEEWSAMAAGGISPRAEEILDTIWESLQGVEATSPRHQALHSEALARFNDLSDGRSHRLHCSLLRLPQSMWVLLLTNGALVIGSMWMFGMESFWAHALMTGALAVSVGFILFLIADLDNPFQGSWSIKPEVFERALRHRIKS
jgi:hypothetical protein